METQDKFVSKCVEGMGAVLMHCNQLKQDCICSIQVSYVDDANLPENARFKTSIYCAKKGDLFHTQTAKSLKAVNQFVDPISES
jgi:hypothetical protein